MHLNQKRLVLLSGAVIVFAGPVSLAYAAAEPNGQTAAPNDTGARVVLAEQSNASAVDDNATMADRYPDYQRGVRQAAREGNEALRRYIWRTRMIYNFQFRDFAKE